MKKVIVIGAGQRAQEAILPALWYLRDTHEVIAVQARTARPLSLFDGQFIIETTSSLSAEQIREASLIMIAVTIEQVPHVLKELSAHDTRHIVLMLDTPVLPPRGLGAMRYFSNFKRVLVSEDTVALPPFLAAKTLIDSGAIGAVRKIYFFHNGYTYHALAGLKALAGALQVRSIVHQAYPGGWARKTLRFPGSVRAVICEPRDYEKGRFLIVGEKGSIADYDHPGTEVHRIEYLKNGEAYEALAVDGSRVPDSSVCGIRYARHAPVDAPIASLMYSMKVRALMELIAASTEANSPFHYAPLEAVVDNLLMILVGKLGFAVDPRHPFGRRLA